MKSVASTIIFPFMAIILVISIAAPSLIKLSHAIYEHHDLDCQEKSAVHFHQTEIDCDFEKYNNATQYALFVTLADRLADIVIQERTNSQYYFLSKYQKHHFVLRGPPSIS